ncbi:MAG: hypothetical protein R3B72_12060 [Polyangiaceae bacterium]
MTRAFFVPFVLATLVPAAALAQDADAPAPNPEAKPAAEPEEDAAVPARGDAPPPNADEVRRWTDYVSPGVDIIGQYGVSLRKVNGETDWFHEFEIPRIFGTITGHYEELEARLVVESVRSSSEGALIGVAGDSFVIRLREAYAGYTAFEHLELKLGLVRTLTIPALQRGWDTRAISAVGTQRVAYASPADLGATARGLLPEGFGWVGVGAYNGEGYNRRELNRGKNVEIAAEIHPLAFIEAVEPLGLFFSYVSGSTGVALARQNRFTGAVMWTMDRLGVGASVVYAQGVQDRGETKGALVEGWVRGEPYDNVLLAAQVAQWWRDLDAPERDTVLTVTGAAGYRILEPLEAFLAVDALVTSDAAATALPELDDYRFRAVTRVSFDDGGF